MMGVANGLSYLLRAFFGLVLNCLWVCWVECGGAAVEMKGGGGGVCQNGSFYGHWRALQPPGFGVVLQDLTFSLIFAGTDSTVC
jgi:hypothetical protein